MDKVKKVGVIGSYAVGMTITTDKFPVGGETVRGSGFKALHGGKGSNQAIAAARMGAEVIYGGCVGNDSFGNAVFDLYEHEKIDTRFIKRSQKGQSTGVGLIYVNKDGENEIVIDLAANFEFSKEHVDEMISSLKECELLLMQLEIAYDVVLYAAKRCKEIGLRFVLNPAPYQVLTEELLECCDYLTPNQTEARLILGLKADDPISDEEVAKRIHKMGVKNVIVTLGCEGALYVNDTECKRIPGIRVKPVDTTGAGDTFSASFCVALAEGKSAEEAIKAANVAAGLAVTKYGVIESIPFKEEVENYLAKEVKEA